MSFLKVSGVYRKERDFILRDISFTQHKLQKIAIAGETGSGKSSLLKIIAGWIPPDQGAVFFEGERVKKVPAEKLVPGHPGIAYLSQQFELPNFLSVLQVLQYANTLSVEEANLLFEVCRISHLLQRRTDQLSGGEKQRIALARLLVSSPRLLLLDEPFSNLDLIHKNLLKTVIHDIGELLQVTCLLVSHDPQDTLSWADHILAMKDGVFVQQDDPLTIYHRPVNEYVAGLFGKYYRIDAALLNAISSMSTTASPAATYFRAEDFAISSNGITGKVTGISFLGHSWEIAIELMGQLIAARSQTGNFQIGDEVQITFAVREQV